FVVALLYGFIYLVVHRRLKQIGKAWQAANSARYRMANEALRGIKDVAVTQTHKKWLSPCNQRSREFSRHAAAAETLTSSPLYIVEAVGYSGLIVISLALLLRSNDVAEVLPAVGLYGFAAYRLLPAVQIMYRGVARLRFSSAVF